MPASWPLPKLAHYSTVYCGNHKPLDFASPSVGDSNHAVPLATPRGVPDTSWFDKKGKAMKKILAVVAWAVFVTAAAGGVATAQIGPRFTLSGVVVVEGGGRAWLQEPQLTQNQPVALRPGESIGPYRLTKIFEDRVELVGPGGPISVLLAGNVGPVTSAAMPPPQPSPPIPAPEPGVNHVGGAFGSAPPGSPRVDFGSLLRGIVPQ